MWSYEDFKTNFYSLTRIDLSLYKERQMKRRIDTLISRYQSKGYEEFFERMVKDKEVFNAFINYMTINVSEFYRNPEQWEILKQDILPILLKKGGTLNLWSSACSTGDEPYTLAMVVSSITPISNVRILATDIDLEAINKAKQGIYTAKSISGLSETFKKDYFTKIGDDAYAISDVIKNAVEFKQINLLRDPYPSNIDLIFCRNVMIYFTDEAKDEMYRKFNDSLVDGGFLFVGSTEQIISPNRFGFEPFRTFFYRK